MSNSQELWEQFRQLLQTDFKCPVHHYEYEVVCTNKACIELKGNKAFLCTKCLIVNHNDHKEHFNCIRMLKEIVPEYFEKQFQRQINQDSLQIKSKAAKINLDFEQNCQKIIDQIKSTTKQINYKDQIEKLSNINGMERQQEFEELLFKISQDLANYNQFDEEQQQINSKIDTYFNKIKLCIKQYSQKEALNKKELALPTISDFTQLSNDDKIFLYTQIYNDKYNNKFSNKKSKKGNKHPQMENMI